MFNTLIKLILMECLSYLTSYWSMYWLFEHTSVIACFWRWRRRVDRIRKCSFGSSFWCLLVKMGDFRLSEYPSCKMNMRHGDLALLFPGKKWLYKYFCFIYNVVSTEKVEAMTIRYFSHSKSTFTVDEYDLNILNHLRSYKNCQCQI